MRPKNLSQRPRFFRASIARGLKTADTPDIDPEGGDEGAGIIRGMAVITRGEALGHDLWIDRTMLASVAQAINAGNAGIKSRFTHPGLSSDGLGKYLGRAKNAVVEGDVVRADLHFSQAAHETPDGDLADYVMTLAASDPEAFGNSIVFAHDFDAEDAFVTANGGDTFSSPDPLNAENFPHARLKALRAVDTVDEPAANPHGLFHRGQEIVQEAEALMAFSLGLSDQRPQLAELDLDPDRVGAFMQRFLDRHSLAIVSKSQEHSMPPDKSLTAETPPEETPPTEEPQPDKPAEKPVEKPEEKPAEPTATSQVNGAAFLSAFGDKGGVWFAQGKTFAEAQRLFTDELKAQNAALVQENQELKAKSGSKRGEATPLSFSGSPPTGEEQKLKKLQQNLGPGLAKFAATNRFVPSTN